MDSISLDRRTKIYFDIHNKIIGRKPTKSNLRHTGSDNSLYIGMSNNEIMSGVIKKIFSCSSVNDYKNKEYTMNAYGINVHVSTNINKDGQLQIKICGNGTMYLILSNYKKFFNRVNEQELILFVDFKNNKIYFKEEGLLWVYI